MNFRASLDPTPLCDETKVTCEQNYKDVATALIENELTNSSDSIKNAFDELSLRDTLKTYLGEKINFQLDHYSLKYIYF